MACDDRHRARRSTRDTAAGDVSVEVPLPYGTPRPVPVQSSSNSSKPPPFMNEVNSLITQDNYSLEDWSPTKNSLKDFLNDMYPRVSGSSFENSNGNTPVFDSNLNSTNTNNTTNNGTSVSASNSAFNLQSFNSTSNNSSTQLSTQTNSILNSCRSATTTTSNNQKSDCKCYCHNAKIIYVDSKNGQIMSEKKMKQVLEAKNNSKNSTSKSSVSGKGQGSSVGSEKPKKERLAIIRWTEEETRRLKELLGPIFWDGFLV